MKSETYQKEGWFTLDVENRVFGTDAESYKNNINLESEDFIFDHQNKEEALKNIENSSNELTDFIDSLIKDVPAPSEEEIDKGIEKILGRVYAEKNQTQAANSPAEKPNNEKKKKITLKVLFLAAVLSLLSFSCLLAVGNSRNISIENGFMAFAKETVQVVFFGEKNKGFISVDSLLADLESHGFGDILFPEEFITNSDEYKVSVPVYGNDGFGQVSFYIYSNEITYFFGIYNYDSSQQSFGYFGIGDSIPVTIDSITANVIEFKNHDFAAEFVYNDYRYYIQVNAPYSELVRIIKTIQ